MDNILAGLLAALSISALIFAYFQAKLFIGVLRVLVKELTALKAFSIGSPQPGELSKPPVFREPDEPSHPDFGVGDILKEVEEAEEGDV